MGFVVVLTVKLTAIVYATIGSIRARFRVGIGAIVALTYITLARGLLLVPPYVELPLGGVLESFWWSGPTLLAAISTGTRVLAFRRSNEAPRDTPEAAHVERAAFAFLGNALLDVALLGIFTVAHFASAQP